MVNHLQQLAAKSQRAIIAYHIYDNWRTKRQFSMGRIGSTSGSTHSKKTLEESLSYIDQVFNDYLRYADISVDMLQGKRILEIGPGDNVGVVIKFLLAGAKQVVCLDKFLSKQDWQQQHKIYQALREQLDESEKQVFDEVIDFEKGITSDSQKLSYIYGIGIEEANRILERESFNMIISRAVFEHLYDPDAAFSAMDKLLMPGGYMIHKIDFRDHGMFSGHGHHPLTFLTIPERVYRSMILDSGKPNRRLIDYYRQKAKDLGYNTKIFITHLVGIESELLPHKEAVRLSEDYSDSLLSLLKDIRPRLQPQFRDMPDEDIMVSGIFLVMRKL